MNHIDSKLLVNYNPLIDPHLRSYFSHERVQSHLRHAGLINRRGEIISDGEYRRRLTRREHKKHVRHVLAENIVHRAIDMERARQAELRHRLDMVTKAALVHNVKEARRYPGGSSSANISKSDDMGASWFKVRPKSTSQHRDVQLMTEEYDGQSRILRVQSANVNDDLQRKHPLNSSTFHHHRPPTESKRSAAHRSSSLHHARPITKSSESSLSNSPCRITMIYYGTNIKREHDHPIFESVDEVLVMQQHCGGENLIVYRANLKPGDEFTFNSRRHAEYPLGLSLYIKGLIDSRISTCCEYKHRHGVRLGGERGHFAIISVEGSKPCLKCRFEKQIQSKELNETIEDEEKKPITISIAVSDEPKRKQTPVKIPVRHTSPPPASEENYSEDFDDSDKGEKMNKHQPASKSNSKQTKFQDTPVKTHVPPKTSSTKIWQIIFYSSNIPTGSFQLPKKASVDVSLKISLLSSDGQHESEQYEINMRDYPHYFKSGRQDLFRAKLRDIDQLKQIRLLLEINDDHHEEIKWHLDHIEVIDPDTRIHYRFSCNQWIRPSEEKLFNLTESFDEKKSSYKQKPAIKPTPQSSTDDDVEPKKIPYRVVIHPAKDHHGEFNASNDSRIFLRVNDQNKDSFLYKNQTKSCPSFESGEQQTFPIDLIEKPTKLTVGYYNTDITAGKWKLQKIVLINTKTNEETVFPCRESLIRNEVNSRAEKTFQAQLKLSEDDNRAFEKKDSIDKQEVDSRPKTRRGRQDTLENEQPSNKSQPTSDIWRPSSDSEPVDLSRSTDQKKRQVLSINSD